MITTGCRVKVPGEGKGNVTDLILRDGQAFAEVSLDNGKVIEVNGPGLQTIYR